MIIYQLKHRLFSLFIRMRKNSFWNILWIDVHLLSTVVSNGGFHHISLYSRILEPWYQMVVFTTSLSILVYWNRGIKWWFSPHLSLFSYIRWIQRPPMWVNISTYLINFCQQYFPVVNIHTILTWGFQPYWGFSTQTEARYTASFCFWCGHWLPSSCNIACLQLLNCFWCSRGHKSYSCIIPEPWPWQG